MKEGKTCKICSKTFTRRNYLQKHMEKIHSKRYSCPVCSRYFDGPTEHSCAISDGRYTCYVENCKLKFANGICLRLHIRDAHKKIEENLATGAHLKTKKAACDMVKTLCKKINVLSKCFDELRYQMNNITDFLKTIGYEDKIIAFSKATRSEAIIKTDDIDMDDYIDYIEEGLIEEVSAEDDETTVDDCELLANARDIESVNNGTVTIFPKFLNQNAIWSPIEVLNEPSEVMKSTTTTIEDNYQESLPIITIPSGTEAVSTAIRKASCKIVPVRGKICRTSTTTNTTLTTPMKKATNLDKSTSAAPPLFLKIQYDETEVCKTDPKITFHFDTRPLDNNDDYILPT